MTASNLFTSILLVFLACPTSVFARFGDIYCGNDNCYDLLNVNRNDDRDAIRRSYRKLAREYHPDRKRTPAAKQEAESYLRKLNIAYEILLDEEQRRDYDNMLDNPDQMYFHYYQYYRRRYSPKVDVRLVIGAIILICSALQYIGQWTSYNQALTYLARDPKHRTKAREIANAEGLLAVRRRDDGSRFTREELKEREEEVLRTVIQRTVDLRGDCSRPSFRRLLVVRLVLLPYTCLQWFLWITNWVWSYWILRNPYDDEAKVFLTRRRLGMSQAQWDGLGPSHQEGFLKKQLWIPAEYKAYMLSRAEELRVQAAEHSQHKRYRRYIKRVGGPPQLGMDDMDF
ncbi:hypothetical protein P879_05650 [Paragonimus westermani]|uniref:J domain-containing protein n=1 Tax=Paragonimus westermani TaxID=34504 RepID=A0A8T0DL33_9TREM|nr:hypothetical protein P879_05650 [Paragonimus westermani]